MSVLALAGGMALYLALRRLGARLASGTPVDCQRLDGARLLHACSSRA